METFVFTSDPAPPDAAATHSSALWRALLEATADAVLVVGARGLVLVTNPAFNRLFGLQGPASIPEGLSFGELCERLGEAFADTPQFLAHAAELHGQEGAVAGEWWTMTDGRTLEADVLPVVVEGRRIEQLWLWRDVTERARLRAGPGHSHAPEANLSYLDELTGLYNRRGFLHFARAQLDGAALARRPMLLIFVDLDALKEINDRLGHAAGDQALVDTGTVLKSTFRERDIVARLGGDEFVVLVTDSSAVREADLLARLSGRLGALNARAGREFQLALSIGVAAFDPGSPESLEELLSEADSRMYLDKRRRKDAAAN
ncbi:MAG: sensor domain-containing diguanylate cyclase [Myxococcaceae bacterium]|nr:MAG: sensor domain-containing diguanylate cyclase [Myxococcaceae bacterium]